MFSNIWTVAEQVLILFILIALGYLGGKTKLITDAGADVCTHIVLYFATPALIIQSFQRDFDPALLVNMLIIVAITVGSHVVGGVMSTISFRNKLPEKQRTVLRFGSVFCNCAFMGLPMQRALLGDIGVFYGGTYGSVVTLIQWSYGLATISGGKGSFSLKKMFLSPGVIAWVVGVILFVTSIKLPDIIMAPIGYLSELTTPVPMLAIGYYLAKSGVGKTIHNKHAIWAIVLRLVVIPMICFGILVLTPLRGDALVSSMITISTPMAAVTTMFAAKCGQDTDLSAGLVSLSTLLSIVTMPIIVALAQMVAYA